MPSRSGPGPAGIHVDGLRELRQGLKEIDKTLPRQLTQEIRQLAEPVRAEAARLAPRSTTVRTGRRSVLVGVGRTSLVTRKTQRNQHVGDTLKVAVRGSKVVIYSRRTGASVIHWGGRHPLFGDRDHWYRQKAAPFIAEAADHHAAQLRRDLAHLVEHLMDRIGFDSH